MTAKGRKTGIVVALPLKTFNLVLVTFYCTRHGWFWGLNSPILGRPLGRGISAKAYWAYFGSRHDPKKRIAFQAPFISELHYYKVFLSWVLLRWCRGLLWFRKIRGGESWISIQATSEKESCGGAAAASPRVSGVEWGGLNSRLLGICVAWYCKEIWVSIDGPFNLKLLLLFQTNLLLTYKTPHVFCWRSFRVWSPCSCFFSSLPRLSASCVKYPWKSVVTKILLIGLGNSTARLCSTRRFSVSVTSFTHCKAKAWPCSSICRARCFNYSAKSVMFLASFMLNEEINKYIGRLLPMLLCG